MKKIESRYLSHAYDYKVAGEDLPITPTTDKLFYWPRVRAALLIAVPLFLVIDTIGAYFVSLYRAFVQYNQVPHGQAPIFELGNLVQKAIPGAIPIIGGNLLTHLMAMVIALLIAWSIAQHLNYATRSVAHDQLGDARLLKLEEIKDRYKAIPEKQGSFRGYGGLPVSHYKHQFYVTDETVNTLTIGTSRSGKGQTTVLQMIDNLSRAEKQSSMVLNDPKGELFVAAQKTLKERGYDVFVLNLDDPSQSMSYNPLSLIIKAWQRGDMESATQMINTLTHSLYASDDAGENKWVYEGAQSAVNGMIMAVLDYCISHGFPERVTAYNVADMLNELGTLNYAKDPENPFVETNALDAFFDSLPPTNNAKKQYGSTNFSAAKAKGSILSTVNQGLAPFVMPKNAKMTSLNSLNLKSIGFPKSIDIQFPETLFNQLVTIHWFRDQKEVASGVVRVGYKGYTEYNFDSGLHDGDLMVIKLKDTDKFVSFKLKFPENDDDKRVELLLVKDRIGVKNASMYYSDKPVAVFMLIPDSDTSNHALASIFIRQLYTELSKQTRYSPGKKCIRRVHFVLDEFGNMIKIPGMDQILTVTNGRNMLWDLVIQSYKQLTSKYGDSDSNTIKENCQVTNYIFSNDEDTQEEISKRVGNKTGLSETNSKDAMNVNDSIQQNAEAQAVLTVERISGLLEGETIVFDPLHRRDLHHKKVRTYPIFNTKETVMPYAYQFLKPEFDPDGDINLIDIKSQHANLDLADLSIDYREFLVDDAAKAAYQERLNTTPTYSSNTLSQETAETSGDINSNDVEPDEITAQSPQEELLESVGIKGDVMQSILSSQNYAAVSLIRSALQEQPKHVSDEVVTAYMKLLKEGQ